MNFKLSRKDRNKVLIYGSFFSFVGLLFLDVRFSELNRHQELLKQLKQRKVTVREVIQRVGPPEYQHPIADGPKITSDDFYETWGDFGAPKCHFLWFYEVGYNGFIPPIPLLDPSPLDAWIGFDEEGNVCGYGYGQH